MLKRLRKKFIAINMTLVAVVLLCVFAAVCAVSYQSLRLDIERSLEMGISQHGGRPVPMPKGEDEREPKARLIAVYTLRMDADGQAVQQLGAFSLSQEVLDEAARQILESGQEEGRLHEPGFYYRVRRTPEGVWIALADAAYLSSSMKRLVLTSLLIGLGGLTAFLIISVFLSRWALRPVERAWAQQRQFVADASHELKTPLTVILANQKILLAHPDATIAQQRRWIDNTDEEAQHMRRLVEDLLFLARSEAVEEKQESVEIDLSELSFSLLLQFEPMAYERGVTLDSDIVPELRIQGDPTRIRQLIHILLDNACKYAGEAGKVLLCLSRQPGGILLEVRNTGDPISPEDLPHLFERFYRSDKARGSAGGFGLGLAIAKGIAERSGAVITAESSAGSGTRLCVKFRG
ncbi:MAG: two-component sensor histidine kinase [Clostridiales bacterium]|nr:two-component sensor histidine kinase [Clostridiales bacterium]